MLDANDIQMISKIMSNALAEERKHTEAMLAQQKKELRQELHEDMMTLLESDVYPRIQLLAEGHEILLEKINRIERNTEIEGRIEILEQAAKNLNREVAVLKTAQ